MKLAIMQPYLFPYIGYFQLIHAVDRFVIYDDVTYIKQGWINRNNICLHGKKHLITLALRSASSNRLIKNIEHAGDTKKMLKTVAIAYAKAPYRDQVLPLIENILLYPEANLVRFIHHSLKEICNYLGITTPMLFSSYLPKNGSLTGQEKVIDICSLLGAAQYVNSIGGKQLYSAEAFAQRGIELLFLESQSTHYIQQSVEFLERLSIIDVLMNNSLSQVRMSLDKYRLVTR